MVVATSRRARRLLAAGILLPSLAAAVGPSYAESPALLGFASPPGPTLASPPVRFGGHPYLPPFDRIDRHRGRSGIRLASTATPPHDGTPSIEIGAGSLVLPDDVGNAASPKRLGTGSTAVILNVNARSVTPPLISVACDVVGEENVFVTRSREDAVLAARAVVRGRRSTATNGAASNGDFDGATDGDDDDKDSGIPLGYSLVVPVGGDGTLSGWIDAMVDEIMLHDKPKQDAGRYTAGIDDDLAKVNDATVAAANGEESAPMTVEEALRRLPLVGYVPMGTGNGLGYVVGCKTERWGSNNKEGKRSILSRLNVVSRIKQRKLDRARWAMARLKEVGDAAREVELCHHRQQQHHHHHHQQQLQLDIADALSGRCSIVEMPLIEVTHPPSSSSSTIPPYDPTAKGDLCFFCGAGFDSLMLHDFHRVKAWSQRTTSIPSFAKRVLSSVAGYCVALVARTLPQTVRHGTHRIQVEATTADKDALWVDHRRGDFSEPAAAQSDPDPVIGPRRHLLYSGTAGIVAASTAPYYGGGLRMFPYARLLPGRMHLRLGRISPLTGFLNVFRIFDGSYREGGERSFGCLDFIGREFEVEVRGVRYEEHERRRSEKKRRKKGARSKVSDDEGGQNGSIGEEQVSKGFPFQHSGESMGVKECFRLRVVPEPVRFVSFLEPRVVVDD